jgi:hypothetical protein
MLVSQALASWPLASLPESRAEQRRAWLLIALCSVVGYSGLILYKKTAPRAPFFLIWLADQ